MPTATLEALEQRVTVIERKFAALEQHTQTAIGHEATSTGTLGLFADEPDMVDEMMALIRAERDKFAQMPVRNIE